VKTRKAPVSPGVATQGPVTMSGGVLKEEPFAVNGFRLILDMSKKCPPFSGCCIDSIQYVVGIFWICF
jgi:hypothetical protein